MSKYIRTYTVRDGRGVYAVAYRDTGETISEHTSKREAAAALARYEHADKRREG